MSQISDILENAILVTADLVGLYSSIVEKAWLKAHSDAMDKRDQKHIPAEKLTW